MRSGDIANIFRTFKKKVVLQALEVSYTISLQVSGEINFTILAM